MLENKEIIKASVKKPVKKVENKGEKR